MKIPENPWSRYGVSDERWQLIFIFAQVVMTVGVIIMVVGMFLGEDKQYVHDLGTFLLSMGMLPLIAGNKSEDEDEYDKIFRIGFTVLLTLGLIGLPAFYFIKLVW